LELVVQWIALAVFELLSFDTLLLALQQLCLDDKYD
jgi:hypothetical protein